MVHRLLKNERGPLGPVLKSQLRQGAEIPVFPQGKKWKSHTKPPDYIQATGGSGGPPTASEGSGEPRRLPTTLQKETRWTCVDNSFNLSSKITIEMPRLRAKIMFFDRPLSELAL